MIGCLPAFNVIAVIPFNIQSPTFRLLDLALCRRSQKKQELAQQKVEITNNSHFCQPTETSEVTCKVGQCEVAPHEFSNNPRICYLSGKPLDFKSRKKNAPADISNSTYYNKTKTEIQKLHFYGTCSVKQYQSLLCRIKILPPNQLSRNLGFY